uniref:outer dense fiber protein 4 n=1 Tax=Ictidomys tridecemlineatus TaxID=43179 RepID=UPI001A9DD846|nr:outer dense fiber protein 4 [Ictidomys tridecemlineatus]
MMDNKKQSPSDHRRNSALPLQWRMTHSSRWMAQVAASELSLVAFIFMLIMVFSKKWLHPSGSRFYKRYPKDINNIIHTSVHVMSLGLLYTCPDRSCSQVENEKDTFKIWTNHPLFGVAKVIFSLALGIGFLLTIWLHLPYLPGLQKVPAFGLIGTIMSFCEVTLIFSVLLLYPINLWIFEVKKNLSVPLGWSYFIGWLVFILYVSCGILCYLNYRTFWSVIVNHPSHTGSCSISGGSVKDTLNDQTISETNQRKFLDREQKNYTSAKLSIHVNPSNDHSPKS